MDEKTVARFWSKVDKNGPIVREGLSRCWIWTGTSNNGYGRFVLHTPKIRALYAHRVSWALLRGDTGGLCVLHRCDTPRCCNPDHLFLGTRPENSADMKAKGRSTRGRKRPGFSGSKHPRAKLTEERVSEVRAAHRASGLPVRVFARERAAEFSIKETTLRSLLQRRQWKHVA